jgi:hypothetical protein
VFFLAGRTLKPLWNTTITNQCRISDFFFERNSLSSMGGLHRRETKWIK